MEIKSSKQEWDLASIKHFEYNAGRGRATISWKDNARQIWLTAELKGVVFFKASCKPEDWELDFAT